ncbi:unnamed protein product [Rhizoctonia solani]|uniref:Zn(2)-C6 fungal-type domain-containing protein n=1 Tax=Rhizoctonia solani TaxID=456999 RepID=A0A8H3DJX3_9AGAM|nr:unnamed protein product [Rhizoctonia solani]
MSRKARPGPVGTSCLTCKRRLNFQLTSVWEPDDFLRHKKCDQRQPVCERCEVGQLECLGYSHNRRAPVLAGRPEDLSQYVPVAPKYDNAPTSILFRINEGEGLENQPIPEQSPKNIQVPSSFPGSFIPIDKDVREESINHMPQRGNASTLVSLRTRKVEDYLHHFATRPTFNDTDSPMTLLCKIVNSQTKLPYSPLDPLETFLNSQWLVEYIFAQADKIMEYWYFKPKNYKKKRFLEGTAHRLQTSILFRWTALVGLSAIQSFYAGDTSQDPQHNFWLGYIENSAKRELSRDLAPGEMQERRSDWVHIFLMKSTTVHGSKIYHMLRSVAPTFLQVVYSDPTLWPRGCNVTLVPLSNVLVSEVPGLAFFAFADCTCAMAFGLPQQVEYDTTIYSRPTHSPSYQWGHSTPAEFQLILAEVNACRDMSPSARNWKDIEQWLLTWQSRPDEHAFTESWMTIAWYAVQESWRLALLTYLYMAVCGTSSDDPRILSCIKQLLQVVGTVKERGSSSAHVSFFVQYLVAGICARSEAHRKVVRDKLLSPKETKLWILRAEDFVPVLDHLWHGAAAGGRPIKWSDYMRSRETILPIVI